MTQPQIREDIIEALVATGKWGKRTAEASERAGHKCEYCGLDFLYSPENYKLFTVDHIVPISGGGDDSFDNLAIACKPCNVDFKNKWNPKENIGDQPATRKNLMDAVRGHIGKKKLHIREEIEAMRKIVGYFYKIT